MGVNLSWIEDGLAVLLRHENIIICLVLPEAEFMNVPYNFVEVSGHYLASSQFSQDPRFPYTPGTMFTLQTCFKPRLLKRGGGSIIR
jgi:hypothetical protein